MNLLEIQLLTQHSVTPWLGEEKYLHLTIRTFAFS